jgi:hypothetical protein
MTRATPAAAAAIAATAKPVPINKPGAVTLGDAKDAFGSATSVK